LVAEQPTRGGLMTPSESDRIDTADWNCAAAVALALCIGEGAEALISASHSAGSRAGMPLWSRDLGGHDS
jgi:hypothetical protein